ncbi:MAG: hypothetical protein R3F60_07665 [bacterium]
MAIAPVLLVLAVALVGKHLPRRALAGAALVALGFGVMAAPRVLDLGVTGLLADGAALAAVLALALRLPTRLLPLATLAALAAEPVLACAALAGLAVQAGQRRAGVALAVAAAGFFFWISQFGDASRVVVQLRALPGFALLLGAVALLPAGARSAGLGVFVLGFARFGLPLWPEGFAVLAPWLAWAAGGLALVAGLAALRWRSAAALAPLGVLGALTGTSPGLAGAALLGAALVAGGWAGVPLAAAGAALALWGAAFAVGGAVGPVSLGLAGFAVLALAASRWRPRSPGSTSPSPPPWPCRRAWGCPCPADTRPPRGPAEGPRRWTMWVAGAGWSACGPRPRGRRRPLSLQALRHHQLDRHRLGAAPEGLSRRTSSARGRPASSGRRSRGKRLPSSSTSTRRARGYSQAGPDGSTWSSQSAVTCRARTASPSRRARSTSTWSASRAPATRTETSKWKPPCRPASTWNRPSGTAV